MPAESGFFMETNCLSVEEKKGTLVLVTSEFWGAFFLSIETEASHLMAGISLARDMGASRPTDRPTVIIG